MTRQGLVASGRVRIVAERRQAAVARTPDANHRHRVCADRLATALRVAETDPTGDALVLLHDLLTEGEW